MSGYDDDHREGAHLAKAAYEAHHGDSHEVTGRGWRLLKHDGDRAFFERERDDGSKEAAISFAGTRLGDKKKRHHDLLADAAIFLGLEKFTKRYSDSEAETRRLVETYGKENVRAVGHSLGAHQAAHVGRTFGIRADAYSPPVSLANLKTAHLDALRRHPPAKNVTFHVIRKDPVSIGHLGLKFGVKTHKQRRANPHSLKNFLD